MSKNLMMKTIPKNKKLILDRFVFFGSFATSFVLLLIYINYSLLQSDFVLIGVFQELLTIPCILSQPILLFLAIRGFCLDNYNIMSYSFFSIIISLVTLILAFGSLLLSILN